jgi:hypothetical protein
MIGKEYVMTPQILIDIVEALKAEKIKIAKKVEGEPRVASLQDEGSIIRFLESHPTVSKYIFPEKPRAFGDMIVLDYDGVTRHPVNIKTSIGSTDNATSKGGFVYALTDLDIEDIPFSMGWEKYVNLIDTHSADIPGKDYWFLSVDKKDSSNVMVRGAKQISNYRENANIANCLQINWAKEKVSEATTRSYEEAYDVLVSGILRCWMKAIENLPAKWRAEICG